MIFNLIASSMFGAVLYLYMSSDPELNKLLCRMEDPQLSSMLIVGALARNSERAVKIATLFTDGDNLDETYRHICELSAQIIAEAKYFENQCSGRSIATIVNDYTELRLAMVMLARSCAPGVLDKVAASFYI
ncbi:MAG: hypothetical protein JWO13_2299 [Acidobacteriales bacterium]|nr:hypothetical protein [Terriglobales bacterium]